MSVKLIEALNDAVHDYGFQVKTDLDGNFMVQDLPIDSPIQIKNCHLQYHPARKTLYVFHETTGVCILRITGLKVPEDNIKPQYSRCTLAEIQIEGHADISTYEGAVSNPSSAINGKALVR